MQIFVGILHGQTYTLDVEPQHTIKMIKQQLEAKGVDMARFRLLSRSFRIEDDDSRTLASYGIQKESTLELIHNLR